MEHRHGAGRRLRHVQPVDFFDTGGKRLVEVIGGSSQLPHKVLSAGAFVQCDDECPHGRLRQPRRVPGQTVTLVELFQLLSRGPLSSAIHAFHASSFPSSIGATTTPMLSSPSRMVAAYTVAEQCERDSFSFHP